MNTKQIDLIKSDCSQVLKDPSIFNSLKNEKILITGGTGFIGTWISEFITYLNDNHSYNTKLVLLSRDTSKLSEKAPHLCNRKDIEFQDSDVRNISEISDDVSWIIHAGSTPDHRVHASNPSETIDIITNGASSVLRSSLRLSSLKKVLNISSGLIYGNQPMSVERIDENFLGTLDSTTVNAAYAESKRCAETIFYTYKSQYRIPIVNVRPFAFIGPYQFLDRPWAINNFIRDALNNGPIRILGNEKTVRSYMYPSDMVNWLLSILVNDRIGVNVNLGSPEGYTLRKVAETVSNYVGADLNISVPQNQNRLNESRFVPSINLAKEYYNLDITVDFKEAINRTINWFRS